MAATQARLLLFVLVTVYRRFQKGCYRFQWYWIPVPAAPVKQDGNHSKVNTDLLEMQEKIRKFTYRSPYFPHQLSEPTDWLIEIYFLNNLFATKEYGHLKKLIHKKSGPKTAFYTLHF